MTKANETHTTETRQYEVPVGRLPELHTKIRQLNNRCKRLRQPLIQVELVGDPYYAKRGVAVEVELWNGATAWETRYVTVKVQKLTVTGQSPVIKGWRFVAALEHTKAGNVIRNIEGSDLPKKYRKVTNQCEHCHAKRARKETYILRSDKGVLKQVGATCLKDFTGHADPEALAQAATFLGEAFGAIDDYERDVLGGLGGVKALCEVRRYMAFVAMVIEGNGWLSSTKVRETGTDELPTHAVARELMLKVLKPGEKRDEPAPKHFKAAEAAIKWAKAFNRKKDKSEYESNLAISCANEYIEWKNAPLVASGVAMHQKAKDREVKAKVEAKLKAERKLTAHHVGTIGERLRDLPATVLFIKAIEGEWGVSFLYKFLTDDGATLTWFASSSQGLTQGEKVWVTGTVKAHKQYNGEPETSLSRCILSDEAPKPKAKAKKENPKRAA